MRGALFALMENLRGLDATGLLVSIACTGSRNVDRAQPSASAPRITVGSTTTP